MSRPEDRAEEATARRADGGAPGPLPPAAGRAPAPAQSRAAQLVARNLRRPRRLVRKLIIGDAVAERPGPGRRGSGRPGGG